MNFGWQINKIENFCLKFDIMFKSCQHLWSLSSMLEVIAGGKRSLPPILGQRHSSNCIARFFPILSTFLKCLCCTYQLICMACGCEGLGVEFKVCPKSR